MSSVVRTSGRLLMHDGVSLAYQRWRRGDAATASPRLRPLLALHGWLDNSNSFSHLGPVLADNGFDVVAIDHAGHGHSSHAPFGAVLAPATYVEHALYVIDQLNWTKCNVVGHSMGAVISASFAAAFPERLEKLVLIEGLGKISKAASTAPSNLRHAIQMRMKTIDRTPLTAKIHYSFADAVAARMKTVKSFPGTQSLDVSAAEVLVARGGRLVDDLLAADLEDIRGREGRVQFRHDPRLLLPNDNYVTPEQNTAIVSSITAPVLLVTAANGWPFHEDDLANQVKVLEDQQLITRLHLPSGSHHLHMDPSSADTVSTEVVKFLNSSPFSDELAAAKSSSVFRG